MLFEYLSLTHVANFITDVLNYSSAPEKASGKSGDSSGKKNEEKTFFFQARHKLKVSYQPRIGRQNVRLLLRCRHENGEVLHCRKRFGRIQLSSR